MGSYGPSSSSDNGSHSGISERMSSMERFGMILRFGEESVKSVWWVHSPNHVSHQTTLLTKFANVPWKLPHFTCFLRSFSLACQCQHKKFQKNVNDANALLLLRTHRGRSPRKCFKKSSLVEKCHS